MTTGDLVEFFQSGMLIVFKIAGPLLIASMVIGLIIAIFQAATQIHEQTLTFVPKLLVIAVMLLVFGTSMLDLLDEYFRELFVKIAEM
ncbi:MAG: flagellar biosynthesis protein FliQ [Oscillospiraceae bacterium]|jgi:flagellar biosynthetic protein FliQ|nr:flagellar biosynthesis protein FliQ [Oscillospiraceae bacterium]